MSKDAIYIALTQIPKGKVVSYGELGRRAGLTNAARFVGTTLKQLPTNTQLPWHRVVNCKRELSFPLESEAYCRQRARLEAEGVVFIHHRISKNNFLV